MARRTRKPKVVWLPTSIDDRLGVAPAKATVGTQNANSIQILVVPGGTGSTVVDVIPVVRDEPRGQALNTTQSESLADVEGSAYRLRRIVGKIFVNPLQDQNLIATGAANEFLATCGFIVLRCDPGGVPLSAFPAYNIQAMDATADPWIWRRSWLLKNGGTADTDPLVGNKGAIAPISNQLYGSVSDGPHVDAKTARVIANEERLFFVTSITAINGSPGTNTAVVQVITDLRVLASLRKMAGNRRNASR